MATPTSVSGSCPHFSCQRERERSHVDSSDRGGDSTIIDQFIASQREGEIQNIIDRLIISQIHSETHETERETQHHLCLIEKEKVEREYHRSIAAAHRKVLAAAKEGPEAVAAEELAVARQQFS